MSYRNNQPTNVTQHGGIGFVGLLTILFVGLKLTGFIHWSWIWVLSPIWISISFWLFLIILFCILYNKGKI